MVPFRIIEKIGENAYKLELPDYYDISLTFNVKDLRPYHGEDLRASLFSQLRRIDARAYTTNIGISTLIIENSNSGGCKTLASCFVRIMSLISIRIRRV